MELLALALSLGLSATEDMTIDQLKALLATYKPVAPQQSASTPVTHKTADAIYREMGDVDQSTCLLKFIATVRDTSKVRLIVKKAGVDRLRSIYTWKELLQLSGAKDGDTLNVLAERRAGSEGKEDWWNAIAISVVK